MFGVMAPGGMAQSRDSTSKSASAAATTIKQGGSNLMNKIFGSKTTPSTTKDTCFNESKQSEEYVQSERRERFETLEQRYEYAIKKPSKGLITPCPFIRPLEHRLQARSEPMPKPKPKPKSIDTQSITVSAITRNREEASYMLNGTLASPQSRKAIQQESFTVGDLTKIGSIAGESTMDGIDDLSSQGRTFEAEDEMVVQIARQLEYVAVTSADHSDAVPHWRYYIDCYSKGQFNLNAPPESPPRSTSFEYLPAVLPPREEERLSVARSYDVVWPRWSQAKASALMLAAMKEFDTVFASLSFFDGKDEVFKAENGYNVPLVSRSMSIAAHALLSDDVFVVLDTEKDWRFVGNPLVRGDPKIRFFAAAPMVSPEGLAVGMFAVFSKEPRATFTAAERRELACYSAVALTDITQQAKLYLDSDLQSLRSTPLLLRDSVSECEYQTPTSKAPVPMKIEHALIPPGLRYQKTKTPPTNSMNVFESQNLSPEARSEHTPPSSSEGSEDERFPSVPRGFDKNHKQLSINVDLNCFPSPPDMITPDSECFRVPTPRPFSASDLTSLNPHPPNTPVLRSQETKLDSSSDLTVESFMSLSDNECAEQESPLIDLSTPETVKETELGANPSSRLTGSSISTKMTKESQRVSDPLAEAAFCCSSSAQSLGYDLIYVVEIKPSRPYMTDNELFTPGGVKKRIVVAYGLDRPMELATEMHLNVLRSRGVQVWENKDATFDNGEFLSGYLLPLPTEHGPHRKRSSGLVFGAFKRPKLVEVGPPDKITAEEMTRLMDAANNLRDILLKQPSFYRLPKRANTEPTSPDRYLANEAVEVLVGRQFLANNRRLSPNGYIPNGAATTGKHIHGQTPYRHPANDITNARKHLLDETPERYPANEAVALQTEQRPIGHAGRSSPNPYIANELVEVGKHIVGRLPYRYPSTETEAVSVAGHHFVDDQPELYPGYPSHETIDAKQRFHDSGIDYSVPTSPDLEPTKEYTATKTVEKSEPTLLDRKPFSFRQAKKAEKKEKGGKSEPGSPDRKLSKETTSSKGTKMFQPTSPDRKTAKALKAAAKVEKTKLSVQVDAGLDRPFHAVARFRPF